MNVGAAVVNSLLWAVHVAAGCFPQELMDCLRMRTECSTTSSAVTWLNESPAGRHRFSSLRLYCNSVRR